MIEQTSSNNFPEIRDAIRSLCAEFPDEYFRKVDEARAYPEQFVDALTKAGWLAALIPQEYGAHAPARRCAHVGNAIACAGR